MIEERERERERAGRHKSIEAAALRGGVGKYKAEKCTSVRRDDGFTEGLFPFPFSEAPGRMEFACRSSGCSRLQTVVSFTHRRDR